MAVTAANNKDIEKLESKLEQIEAKLDIILRGVRNIEKYHP